jgi:gamma-glutamylcyclotransferase (GGCT)/AIG2-like uncharacterized protein YtfP
MRTRRPDHLVFVYGTLLRGQPNHRLLEDSRFVSDAKTEPVFELVDLGPCPAMVPGGEQSIAGEVYAVKAEALEGLDRLEGHPHFYRRTPVRLTSGMTVEAYVLEPRKAHGCALIKSGVWQERDAEPHKGIYVMRSRRLEVDWPAKIWLRRESYAVQVIDVSFVGALIRGAVKLQPGDEADLSFDELPSEPTIHVIVRNMLAVDRLLGLEFADAESTVPDQLLRAATSV